MAFLSPKQKVMGSSHHGLFFCPKEETMLAVKCEPIPVSQTKAHLIAEIKPDRELPRTDSPAWSTIPSPP